MNRGMWSRLFGAGARSRNFIKDELGRVATDRPSRSSPVTYADATLDRNGSAGERFRGENPIPRETA